MGSFAQISSGRERWAPFIHIARHRHDRAYAALVLSGSYEESDQWARSNDLAPATVSRGFSKVFDVTPAEFRLEARTRRALAMIAANATSLAMIAVTTGFADQAHMTRAIRGLTGSTPGHWRRSNRFKTGTAPGRPNPGHESSS